MTPPPMPLAKEADLLLELEESTDAIGRRLATFAGDLARAGLEAGGVAHAPATPPREPLAEQLAAIQRRHTELRALLWTYIDSRKQRGTA
jgi:hypothetical protein